MQVSNAPGFQQPQRQASSAAALPEQRPNAVPSMAPRLPFQQSGGQPEYQWPNQDMDNIASRMGSLSHGGPAPSAPWLFPPHSQVGSLPVACLKPAQQLVSVPAGLGYTCWLVRGNHPYR